MLSLGIKAAAIKGGTFHLGVLFNDIYSCSWVRGLKFNHLILIYYVYKIKQKDTYHLYVSRHSIVAEERGFEPRHTVTCLRAFQARPFSLLGIPPQCITLFRAFILYQKIIICHSLFINKFLIEYECMQKHIVKSQESGQTLEKFVKKLYPNVPLSTIYKLFRKKDVKVNGHWQSLKYIVNEGEEISIYIKEEQLTEQTLFSIKPSNDIKDLIIYEDNNILIVNKPRGLLVQSDSKSKESLDKKVLSYLAFKGEYNPDELNAFTPGPAHRIDRNTSGLVIFGKNIETLQYLFELLKEHEGLSKHYITLVKGDIKEDGIVNAPLKKDSVTGMVKVASERNGGKKAISKYHVIRNYGKYTLLDVEILTGRTHQIRIHMSYINHPVIGDKKYGDFNENKLFKEIYNFENQFLHAYMLEFKKIDKPLDYLSDKIIKTDLPKEYEEILKKLG